MDPATEETIIAMIEAGTPPETAVTEAIAQEQPIIRRMGGALNRAAIEAEREKQQQFAKSIIVKTCYASYSPDQFDAFIAPPDPEIEIQRRRATIQRAQRMLTLLVLHGPARSQRTVTESARVSAKHVRFWPGRCCRRPDRPGLKWSAAAKALPRARRCSPGSQQKLRPSWSIKRTECLEQIN